MVHGGTYVHNTYVCERHLLTAARDMNTIFFNRISLFRLRNLIQDDLTRQVGAGQGWSGMFGGSRGRPVHARRTHSRARAARILHARMTQSTATNHAAIAMLSS